MNNFAWIKGLIFGIIFSFVSALLFMLIGQAWAGGITSFWGESWLYLSVIVPFAITFAVLGGYFHNKKESSNKKLWLISLICAFLVTLYSGTIGALSAEFILRGGSLRTTIPGGYTGVNVEDTLIWGTIYAFILLPLTTPLARFLIGIFYKLIKR